MLDLHSNRIHTIGTDFRVIWVIVLIRVIRVIWVARSVKVVTFVRVVKLLELLGFIGLLKVVRLLGSLGLLVLQGSWVCYLGKKERCEKRCEH